MNFWDIAILAAVGAAIAAAVVFAVRRRRRGGCSCGCGGCTGCPTKKSK